MAVLANGSQTPQKEGLGLTSAAHLLTLKEAVQSPSWHSVLQRERDVGELSEFGDAQISV